MKDYKLKLRDLRVSHTIHWVGRGTGTPKDKDEVRRRILHLIIMVLDSHTTTQSQPPRSSSYSLNPKPIQ